MEIADTTGESFHIDDAEATSAAFVADRLWRNAHGNVLFDVRYPEAAFDDLDEALRASPWRGSDFPLKVRGEAGGWISLDRRGRTVKCRPNEVEAVLAMVKDVADRWGGLETRFDPGTLRSPDDVPMEPGEPPGPEVTR